MHASADSKRLRFHRWSISRTLEGILFCSKVNFIRIKASAGVQDTDFSSSAIHVDQCTSSDHFSDHTPSVLNIWLITWLISTEIATSQSGKELPSYSLWTFINNWLLSISYPLSVPYFQVALCSSKILVFILIKRARHNSMDNEKKPKNFHAIINPFLLLNAMYT